MYVKVGAHTDRLYERSDCRCRVETPTDDATAFSTTRVILAETRTENIEVSSASPGQRLAVNPLTPTVDIWVQL